MAKSDEYDQDDVTGTGRQYAVPDMDDWSSQSDMDRYHRKRRRGDYYTTGDDSKSISNDTDDDEKEDADSENLGLIRKGMKCELKHQYMGREYTHGIISWMDEKPRSMSMEEEGRKVNKTELASFALLIRNQPNYDETESRDTSIHSIVIQSPLIRKCLKGLLARYPNISLDTKFVTFEQPFQPLFYEWNNIKKAIKSETDETTRTHLQLLLEALEPEFRGVFSSVKEFKRHDAISFDHLWAIFKPGDYIYSMKGKTHIALQLKEDPKRITPSRGGPESDYLSLSCQCIDWNGQQFVRRLQVLNIPEYTGTAGIRSLKAYPLEFHLNKEKLKKALRKRGKRFQNLAGTHFVAYKGVTATEKPYYVNGRVVIDSNAYFRFNPGHAFSASRQDGDDPVDSVYFDDGEINSDVENDAVQKAPDDVSLDENQLLICRPIVRGYALKIKKWLDFEVDGIKEIQWNTDVFNYLAIPENLKSLLLAISNAQHESASSFDDIIQGKGKGIIMLLNGPPGVGKTLTAESVAETMKVPLYSISAGDLGLGPQTVQQRLSEALEMATMWKAVLLLDEADVFLEQRTTDNLKRNELVSIFLQNLEYYEGTLFLTTNRVKTLDEAFESRIHLSIDYPELSQESRRKVWKNFLDRMHGDFKLSDEDLTSISQVDVNGREIKNIMKLADLLANSKKMPLEVSHIKTILKVRQENSKIKKDKGLKEG